jgi:predicted LPLAT superfamily acyltransferase
MTTWDQKKERGSIGALRLVIFIYKKLGPSVAHFLLWPVVFYFFLTDFTARRASQIYLKNLSESQAHKISRIALFYKSYLHFISFGRKLIHSLSAWMGEFKANDIDYINKEIVHAMVDRKEGGIVLGAHLGCLEVCRATHKEKPGLKIVPIMYFKNGQKFRSLLKELDPESTQEVILLEDNKSDLPFSIQSRIAKGEFISILADRLSPNSKDRTIDVTFLGKKAKLPEGAFALAYALQCPILTFFSVYDEKEKRYKAYWEKLDTSSLERLRSKRAENLRYLANEYTKRLETLVKDHPYQWFNFFDFWKS